jgi:hypothetical protein
MMTKTDYIKEMWDFPAVEDVEDLGDFVKVYYSTGIIKVAYFTNNIYTGIVKLV